MSSRCREAVPLALLCLIAMACSRPANIATPQATAQTVQQRTPATRSQLRVCADPNNLPFSNEKLEGFENKIASLIARELNLKVKYTWWAQRRGFIRNTLKSNLCDVVIGMPSSSELALTTIPYYRSTYTFVYRKHRGIEVHSFDDETLKTARVGVQMIGDDAANTPPAHALTNRNIVQNVRGYSVYGDYQQANPPARIVDAVAKGEVDIAIAWGPLAGYFAQRESVPLAVVPVSPQIDLPYLPFVYDISMGVRREDEALRDQLNEIITKRRGEIDSILNAYGVPRVDSSRLERASLK